MPTAAGTASLEESEVGVMEERKAVEVERW